MIRFSLFSLSKSLAPLNLSGDFVCYLSCFIEMSISIEGIKMTSMLCLDFHSCTCAHHHQHRAALTYGFVTKIYANDSICSHLFGTL